MTNQEINKEIAEKVMGWKDGKHPHDDFLNSGWGGGYVFSPSTDISDAWLVVEKMREKGFWFDLNNGEGDSWDANFEEKTLIAELHSVRGEKSAPLAICKAALKAIEKDKNV